MCRLAAYSGPPISLDEFLLKPEHGLVSQSWRPREMREAKLNADGFGISWYTDDGIPASYKNTQPIWSDPNLDSLARSLVRGRWLASVRSATLVSDVTYANTQPFVANDVMFTHNGYLADFAKNWRGPIRSILATEFENLVHGTTDSEYLFALFCQLVASNNTIADSLAELVAVLDDLANGSRALLNFIVSSKSQLVALRHAIGDTCPSLYYHVEKNKEGDAVRIASEAFSADDDWTAIDENRLLIADDTGGVCTKPL